MSDNDDEREAREAGAKATSDVMRNILNISWDRWHDASDGGPETQKYKARQIAEAAIDAYKAHLAGKAQDGWQPIETAPKDGERIIAFRQGYVFIACWSEQFAPAHFTNTFDWYDEAMGRRDSLVTHWMPLPAAPSAHEAGTTRDALEDEVAHLLDDAQRKMEEPGVWINEFAGVNAGGVRKLIESIRARQSTEKE